MSLAEQKATELVKQLYEHCRTNRLPALVIIGLVKQNKLAKVWTELSGDSLAMFQASAIQALWQNHNVGMMKTNTPTLHEAFMLWAAAVFGPNWQKDVPEPEMLEREKAYISGMLAMSHFYASLTKLAPDAAVLGLDRIMKEFESYFMDMPLREEARSQKPQTN